MLRTWYLEYGPQAPQPKCWPFMVFWSFGHVIPYGWWYDHMTTSTINAVPPSEVLQRYLFWSLKVGCNMRRPHSLKLEYLCKYSNIYSIPTKNYIYTFTYINIYTNTPNITQELPPNIHRRRPAKQRDRVVVGNGDMEDHFGLSLMWPLFLGWSHGMDWELGNWGTSEDPGFIVGTGQKHHEKW